MRKEIFRMESEAARALLAKAPVVHIASTRSDGVPILRAFNAVVVDGAVCFHAAPAGEKMESIGRPAVVTAEEIVASIPSYFLDPERACPATTLYRSVQAHGVIEEVTDLERKARTLSALLAKYQPEGGHVPITADHPLYKKALAGLLIAQVRTDQIDGKAKLAQNKSPADRQRLCEKLWERGAPGDAWAIEQILAANPDMPLPRFLAGPDGSRLVCAPQPEDADRAAALLHDAYWNGDFSKEEIAKAHRASAAWVGARSASDGSLIATARAITDSAKHAWIYDVVVAPAFRGRGIGQAIMKLLIDHPNVRDARKLHLATKDAHGLYRKLGFLDQSELLPKEYTSSTMHLERASKGEPTHPTPPRSPLSALSPDAPPSPVAHPS